MARGGRGGGRGGGARGGRGGHHGRGGGIKIPDRFAIPLMILLFLFGILSDGGSTAEYEESTFRSYTAGQYDQAFGSSTAYEDNLLIAVAVSGDNYEFHYLAWVGDHVKDGIYDLLGGNDAALGEAMNTFVSRDYEATMTSDLVQVMTRMTQRIEEKGLGGSFSCQEERSGVESHLVNRSQLSIDEAAVNAALADFTARTGIPVVVVVEDMTDLFG